MAHPTCPELALTSPTPFRRRLARNTAASLVTNGWAVVVTFVSVPILLDGLGQGTFGVWVLIQTFSATNGWLSVPAVGLAVSSTRAVASAHGRAVDEHIGRALGASLMSFVGTGVILGAAIAAVGATAFEAVFDVGLANSELDGTVRAFSVQILAEFTFLGVIACFEGLQRVAEARILDAARRTLVVGATCVIAVSGGDIVEVAVGAAAASVFTAIAVLISLLWVSTVRVRRPLRADVGGVARYATTSGALTATGVLHRTMDRVIAGVALGPASVALVEIAAQIQNGCTALLSASTYPVLSTAPWLRARRDRPALVELVERTTRYAVLLTLPLVGCVIVLAGPFIRVWVGADLDEAIGLTQVAVLYVAIVAPLQAGSNALQGLGLAGIVLWSSFVSVAVNLLCSVILVNSVGLVGVFIGTIAGSLVLVPLLGPAIVSRLELPGWGPLLSAFRPALPPTLAVVGASTVALLLPLGDLATLVVGGLTSVVLGLTATLRWSLGAAERVQLRQALLR